MHGKDEQYFITTYGRNFALVHFLNLILAPRYFSTPKRASLARPLLDEIFFNAAADYGHGDMSL